MTEASEFQSTFVEMRLTLTLRVSIPASANPHEIDGALGAAELAIKNYVNEHNMAAGAVRTSWEQIS